MADTLPAMFVTALLLMIAPGLPGTTCLASAPDAQSAARSYTGGAAPQAAGGTIASAQADEASAPRSTPQPSPLQPGEVARAGEWVVLKDDLANTLLAKFALSQEGKEALAHLVKARLLGRLAEESRLKISAAEIDSKVAELEAEITSTGEARSLRSYLARKRISMEKFREFLRLGLVEQKLAADALGVSDPSQVSGERQEMWLNQIVEERGVNFPAAPWKDGIAASCGDLTVSAMDFRDHLVDTLPGEEVRTTCRHLLLVRKLRGQMPDWTDEAVNKTVLAELQHRREAFANNPKYEGLTYDQFAQARGALPGSLERDPELIATALANAWIDQKYDEHDLRTAYQKQRGSFDGNYGEALEVHVLVLKAAEFPNQLIPRSFEQAEQELAQLATQVTSLEAFGSAVQRYSEHPETKKKNGHAGWISRQGDAHENLRSALFAAHSGGIDGMAQLVGPVRMNGSVALAWVSRYREAPEWAVMREHVVRELRREFVVGLLPEGSWITFLD